MFESNRISFVLQKQLLFICDNRQTEVVSSIILTDLILSKEMSYQRAKLSDYVSEHVSEPMEFKQLEYSLFSGEQHWINYFI